MNKSQHNTLLSMAQRKGFFSSILDSFKKAPSKPISNIDKDIKEVNDAIQNIVKYNDFEKHVKLAIKSFEENKLLKVRDYLIEYNGGIRAIRIALNIFYEKEDLRNIRFNILTKKNANKQKNLKKLGIFGLFEKKEPHFEEKYKHLLINNKLEIRNFINYLYNHYKILNNILENLNTAQLESKHVEYVKGFIELEDICKNFNKNFTKIDEEQFKPLFDMKLESEQTGKAPVVQRKIQQELGEITKELGGKKEFLQKERQLESERLEKERFERERAKAEEMARIKAEEEARIKAEEEKRERIRRKFLEKIKEQAQQSGFTPVYGDIFEEYMKNKDMPETVQASIRRKMFKIILGTK